MATVVKAQTTLRRQAAIAGAVLLTLFAACSLLVWHALHIGTFGTRFWVESGAAFVLLMMLGPASDLAMVYIRGHDGERRVLSVLRRLPDEYLILNDVTIAVGGDEAQIDHVVVSPHGLWCIKTKSHRGIVLGREGDQNWTQLKHSERGKRYKNRLYSPIRQNATHCKRLGELLNQRLGLTFPIRSVVVFSHGKFRVESVTPVVGPPELLAAMATPAETCVIGDEDIAQIVRVLHGRSAPHYQSTNA